MRARQRGESGVVLPARVVRATLTAVTVAAVAVILAEAPEARRYYRLATM